MSDNAWLPTRNSSPDGIPLFCFPFAGGGTAVYHAWRLADRIELLPVRLPGRESRFNEKALENFDELVTGILDGIEGALDRPYALFGHSMGATLAYEFARRATASGHPPALIFVSACRAPGTSRRNDNPPIYELPDEPMIDSLLERYGSQASAEERALMLLLAKTLRADLKAFDSFRFDESAPKLECPVYVCGGADDPQVKRADLEAWQNIAGKPISVRVFSGGHFFIRSHPKPISQFVERKLLAAF